MILRHKSTALDTRSVRWLSFQFRCKFGNSLFVSFGEPLKHVIKRLLLIMKNKTSRKIQSSYSINHFLPFFAITLKPLPIDVPSNRKAHRCLMAEVHGVQNKK